MGGMASLTAEPVSAGPADLAPGMVQCRDAGGRRVLIARNAAGDWFALAAVCTHAELPLDAARVRGGALLCPHHGARFELATGKVLGPPAHAPIATYAVRVVDGVIEVVP
jgi:3-phenylpropionate/trans-cinnamate dioxygenase ferredoxin subunit